MADIIVKGTGSGHVPAPTFKAGGPVPGKPLTGSAAASAPIPPGWVLLADENHEALSLLAEMAASFPRMTQGYGGWEEIQRRGAMSLTTFRGLAPLVFELDLYLDDFDNNTSVERSIDVLRALGGRGPLAKPGRPPRLIVNTGGVMAEDSITFPDTRWVINGLDFDETEMIVNQNGNRVRAPVTVTILQYVEGQRLRGVSRPTKATRTYVTKPGDTLLTIARHKLGDASRWPDIAKLNPKLRDPRKKIKAHTKVRLP